MGWSTKLPKKAGGRYLVTLRDTVRQADFQEYPKGHFTWWILPNGPTASAEVIAWQKQPKPYKKEP
jgi:hypothetical protein